MLNYVPTSCHDVTGMFFTMLRIGAAIPKWLNFSGDFPHYVISLAKLGNVSKTGVPKTSHVLIEIQGKIGQP